MRNIFFSFLIILGLFMPPKKTRVIFLGDSITEAGAKPGGYITRIDSMCRQENRDSQFEFIGAGNSASTIWLLANSEMASAASATTASS